MPSFQAALNHIESLGNSGMVFDLSRMRAVVESLGHPQNRFKSVHVAGTNGKGSVAAMLSSVLRAAGLTTGLYTSPHLVKIEERFQINGRMISPRQLTQLTHELRMHFKNQVWTFRALTQFEFLTAVAFLWFFRNKVDVAIVETGLGGRLDATNVMDNKILSIITNIGLEHTQYLGKRISQIAGEKAGIIKPGTPVISGAGREASAVIRRRAAQLAAPCYQVRPPTRRPDFLPAAFPLFGRHQWHNAALVKKAVDILGMTFPIRTSHFKEGLRATFWPGRFEVIQGHPAARNNIVILDGAHNPAAAKALADALRSKKIQKVTLLWGMLKDKDAKSFINLLRPFVAACIIVPLPTDRSCQPSELAGFEAIKEKVATAPDLAQGWKMALQMGGRRPVLVTGSLYLIGAVRKLIFQGK